MLRSILIFSSIIFLSACASISEEEADQKREEFVLKTNYKLKSLPQATIFIKQKNKKFSYTGVSNRLYTGTISIKTPGATETKTYDPNDVQVGGNLAYLYKKALVKQGINTKKIQIIPSNENPELKNSLLVTIVVDHERVSFDGPAYLQTTFMYEGLDHAKLVKNHKFRSGAFGGCWLCSPSDSNDKKAISALLVELDNFLSN